MIFQMISSEETVDACEKL